MKARGGRMAIVVKVMGLGAVDLCLRDSQKKWTLPTARSPSTRLLARNGGRAHVRRPLHLRGHAPTLCSKPFARRSRKIPLSSRSSARTAKASALNASGHVEVSATHGWPERGIWAPASLAWDPKGLGFGRPKTRSWREAKERRRISSFVPRCGPAVFSRKALDLRGRNHKPPRQEPNRAQR